MKLAPKGVEKAAMALFDKDADAAGWSIVWDDLDDAGEPEIKQATYINRATAALTAYFDHLKSEGLMREAAGGDVCGSYWFADTEPGMWENAEFKAVIIKMEDPNAKA